jgi:hypothetical protein
MLFSLFQQQRVTRVQRPNKPDEFESNLENIGTVEAFTAHDAIQSAKHLKEFRTARGLARFPIVEEVFPEDRPSFDDVAFV